MTQLENRWQRSWSYTVPGQHTMVEHLSPPQKIIEANGEISLVCTQEVSYNNDYDATPQRLGVVTVGAARAPETRSVELFGILRWGVDNAKRVTGRVERETVYEKTIPRGHFLGMPSPVYGLKLAVAKRRAIKKVHGATRKLKA